MKISDLKAKYSNHADGRSQARPPKPTFVVDGPGECPERRCACPYDLAYEESREFLFLDNMHKRMVQGKRLPVEKWAPRVIVAHFCGHIIQRARGAS